MLFNMIWLGALAISNIGMFDWYVITLETNLIFLSFILTFNLTYLLFFYKKRKNKIQVTDSSFVAKESINYKLLTVAHILVYSICLPYIPKAIYILTTMGSWYMRHYVYTTSDLYFKNAMIAIFFQWIIQPFFQFILLLSASQITRIKENKRLFCFAILDLLLELLLFGAGRRTIVTFLLEIMIFFVISKKKNRFGYIRIDKKRISALLSMAIIGVAIIYLTVYRLGQDTAISDSLKSMLQYFVGPIIMFDRVVGNGISEALTNGPALGTYTFSFILAPLSLVMRFFTGSTQNSMTDRLIEYLDPRIMIGTESSHNAHATSLIYFYLDYGELFVWVGAVLLAVVIAYFSKNSKKGNTYFLLAVYFTTLTFYSVQTYPFSGIIPFVIIAYAVVFVKNKQDIEIRKLTQ